MSRPSLYLIDVEGTIAPCSLTSERLIPYARTHLEPFLRREIAALEQKGGDLDATELAADSLFHNLALLQAENHAETDPDAPRILPHRGLSSRRTCTDPSGAIPEILAYLNWLMDRDSDSIALKSLQGKIWKTGFDSGELVGTLFEDVSRAFARWRQYARIAIYSSGSIPAQQVFFRHSICGDLTPFIAAYFDTHVGPKIDAVSYEAIAAEFKVTAQEVCFFSDAPRELDAARAAGMDTRLVCRPGNAAVAVCDHFAIRSFDEVP